MWIWSEFLIGFAFTKAPTFRPGEPEQKIQLERLKLSVKLVFMNIKIFLAGFLFVLVSCWSCNNTENRGGGPFDEQWELEKLMETVLEARTSCNKDSDCVLVSEGCCSCRQSGSSIAINKSQEDRYNSQLKKICLRNRDRNCTLGYRCNEFEAKCRNRRCVTINKQS